MALERGALLRRKRAFVSFLSPSAVIDSDYFPGAYPCSHSSRCGVFERFLPFAFYEPLFSNKVRLAALPIPVRRLLFAVPQKWSDDDALDDVGGGGGARPSGDGARTGGPSSSDSHAWQPGNNWWGPQATATATAPAATPAPTLTQGSSGANAGAGGASASRSASPQLYGDASGEDWWAPPQRSYGSGGAEDNNQHRSDAAANKNAASTSQNGNDFGMAANGDAWWAVYEYPTEASKHSTGAV